MNKEKFIRPLIEVVDLSYDIICTSGGGEYVDPGTQGGGELDPIDPWGL